MEVVGDHVNGDPAKTSAQSGTLRDVTAGGSAEQKLSATRAAAWAGLNRHALVDAANAGRVPAERVERRGLGPNGVGYLFVLRDLVNLPRCRYPSCSLGVNGAPAVALGASGGCEAHGHALEAMGKQRSPEIGAKISAAKLGRSRPDQADRMRKYPAEERSCEWCGASLGTVLGHVIRAGGGRFCNGAHARRWYAQHEPERHRRGRVITCACGAETRYRAPSHLGHVHCRRCYASMPATRARKSAATRELWRAGMGVAQAAVARASGPVRRTWKRRWASRSSGALGGRPQSVLPPDVFAEVRLLSDLGWGRDSIATRLGISPRQVRNARAT